MVGKDGLASSLDVASNVKLVRLLLYDDVRGGCDLRRPTHEGVPCHLLSIDLAKLHDREASFGKALARYVGVEPQWYAGSQSRDFLNRVKAAVVGERIPVLVALLPSFVLR